MNKLYVVGDSFTTPYVCVDPQDSFWGLAGKQLGVEQIVNVSRPSNSFDSVCQLLIGMQNQYEYNGNFILFGGSSPIKIDNFYPRTYHENQKPLYWLW